MNKKNAKKIVSQRTRPSIFDYCYITTRAHRKIFFKFIKHVKEINKPVRVLDLGCGYKPFKNLMGDIEIKEYIGIDFDLNRSAADVSASVEDIPFEDDYFDAVIASEVFEHTLQLDKAILELKRVSKKGAIVYITTPFIFGEHGIPYDFQRITKYKYLDLFKNDDMVIIRETNNNLTMLFFVFNVCWETISILRGVPIVTQLIYLFNNLFALAMEGIVNIIGIVGRKILCKRRDWFEKVFRAYFYTMPGGYSVIVKIKK